MEPPETPGVEDTGGILSTLAMLPALVRRRDKKAMFMAAVIVFIAVIMPLLVAGTVYLRRRWTQTEADAEEDWKRQLLYELRRARDLEPDDDPIPPEMRFQHYSYYSDD